MRERKPSLFHDTLSIARVMRRSPTEVERRLWRLLRDRRFVRAKFRRQHPIGPYIVDFYCEKARLVIELDGGGHAERRQIERDAQRDQAFQSRGIRTVRFWDNDVLKNPDGVFQAILEAMEAPSPRPSPGGRGGARRRVGD